MPSTMLWPGKETPTVFCCLDFVLSNSLDVESTSLKHGFFTVMGCGLIHSRYDTFLGTHSASASDGHVFYSYWLECFINIIVHVGWWHDDFFNIVDRFLFFSYEKGATMSSYSFRFVKMYPSIFIRLHLLYFWTFCDTYTLRVAMSFSSHKCPFLSLVISFNLVYFMSY